MNPQDRPFRREVFRVQGLPHHIRNLQDAADFVAVTIADDEGKPHVKAFSLATTMTYWEKPPSKVATVQLEKVTSRMKVLSDQVWAADPLQIDSRFLGMTPLNDAEDHQYDCIAISGLASHPFGSWQPRGDDKSFMWIRDLLPAAIPGLRAIVYGYDSTLIGSKSFQSIHDIAKAFFGEIRAWWSSMSKISLIFLAHSLGGIVLKDAITQMANSVDERDHGILDKVLGAVLFGVPSLGMQQSHLLAMVDEQPNDNIVRDLSLNSVYLEKLLEAFHGISFERKLDLHYAYETLKTRTVVVSMKACFNCCLVYESITMNGFYVDCQKFRDGKWVRQGPGEVLVNRLSATNRPLQQSSPSTIPINEDHSNMVKYRERDKDCGVIISRLLCICHQDPQSVESKEIFDVSIGDDVKTAADYLRYLRQDLSKSKSKDETEKKKKHLEEETARIHIRALEELRAESLDSRQADIEATYENTFGWIFDNPDFNKWTRQNGGLLWLKGKPGCGKSTLMKYVFEHRTTRELLHRDWGRGAREVYAGFFFHLRGSAIQKSMEGVLRSLLSQILNQERELVHIVLPALPSPHMKATRWTIPMMERAIRLILEQSVIKLDLFLFFDALDEFDGHPEAVSSFLFSLLDQQDSSLSRVKICFSSRPWPQFQDNFGSHLQVTIHNYTKADIRDYFVGMMKHSANPVLYLANDVVDRASGVFLWVRLVVGELSRLLSSNADLSVTQLQECLNTLPKELDSFYALIISRISHQHRRKTYVLLELIIRAQTQRDRAPGYLWWAVKAQNITDPDEDPSLLDPYKDEGAGPTTENVRADIALWSGGLAEINWKNREVNLMHQTALEFVSSPGFSTMVLGDNARITRENGFTYHTVGHLTGKGSYHKQQKIAHYARLAEQSTGLSLTRLSDLGVAPGYWEKRDIYDEQAERGPLISKRRETVHPPIKTWLGFAVYAKLFLLIRKKISHQPRVVETADEDLLDLCFRDIDRHLSQETIEMVELLLEAGYPIHRDISRVLSSCLVSESRDSTEHSTRHLRPAPLSSRPFQALLTAWCTEGIGEYIEIGDPEPSRRVLLLSCHALHLMDSSNMINALDSGHSPNVKDCRGSTPLDWILFNTYPWFQEHFSVQERYHKCQILVSEGGQATLRDVLDNAKIQHHDQIPALKEFNKAGFSIDFIWQRWEEIIEPRPPSSSHPRQSSVHRHTNDNPETSLSTPPYPQRENPDPGNHTRLTRLRRIVHKLDRLTKGTRQDT